MKQQKMQASEGQEKKTPVCDRDINLKTKINNNT